MRAHASRQCRGPGGWWYPRRVVACVGRDVSLPRRAPLIRRIVRHLETPPRGYQRAEAQGTFCFQYAAQFDGVGAVRPALEARSTCRRGAGRGRAAALSEALDLGSAGLAVSEDASSAGGQCGAGQGKFPSGWPGKKSQLPSGVRGGDEKWHLSKVRSSPAPPGRPRHSRCYPLLAPP